MGTMADRMRRGRKSAGAAAKPPRPPGKIKGPWVRRTLEMLESPAWRALSLADRKVLERIEVAFLRNHLRGNGNIVCTYDELQAWGIRRASIRRSLDRLEALGWIVTVVKGHRGATDLNFPSRYRLTYLEGFDDVPATNEWRQFDTDAKVRRAIREMEADRDAKPAAQ